MTERCASHVASDTDREREAGESTVDRIDLGERAGDESEVEGETVRIEHVTSPGELGEPDERGVEHELVTPDDGDEREDPGFER